jgi:hypothetical protein
MKKQIAKLFPGNENKALDENQTCEGISGKIILELGTLKNMNIER